MKRQLQRYIIIVMAFLSLMGINANTAWGQQKAIYKFNLYNLPVRFERLTVGSTTEYYCGYWNGSDWSNHTNTAHGTSYRKRCADYEYIQIFHVENHSANDPGSDPPATATNNTVEIVTNRNKNYPLGIPTSSGTLTSVDETLKIELNNVNIEGVSKSALNLGDDCVSVELTIEGTNYLSFSGGSTGYPVISYNRWDGTTSHNKGWKGPGTLTFLGSGSLTATRPSEVNSGSVIGCAQFNQGDPPDCLSNGSLVFNGTGTITAQVLDPTTNNGSGCGSYGAAIGGGGNSRCGSITIKSGTINAYANTTSAAIGGGGGLTGFGADVSGVIQIDGGTVNTYNSDLTHITAYDHTWNNTETGVGIGAGSSNYKNGGTFQSGAKIVINGGTVNVYKRLVVFGSAPPDWERGNIGGGNSNTGGGDDPYAGGAAVVEINGGTVEAANIGGGSANVAGANGGNATVTLKMDGGSLTVSGTIGGGSSISGTGGNATVNVYAPASGTAGTVTAGNIGGGDSQTGEGGQATVNVYGGSLSPGSIGGGNSTSASTTAAGGQATVNVSGGSLTVTGKIGGGKSFGSGAGGNALIDVSGGTLSCQSIGGGDSQSGTPGSVYNNSLTNAGVYIHGGTLNTGTIGGGTRLSDGALGKASVKITAGTIQGQCLLVATGTNASNHCWFEMTGGTIDNTNLGVVGAASYPRLKANGGAVYMEDPNGTVTISGGTIQNCKTGNTLGGAVYMTNGTFTLSGTGKIQDCIASSDGGAVYLGGGTANINGGSLGVSGHPNKANKGAGIFLSTGTLSVTSGSIGYNTGTGTSLGGGAYLGGGSLAMTGGSIEHNEATQGGGAYLGGGSLNMTGGSIQYNEATKGGGLYSDGGTNSISNGNINNNTATQDGGGIYSEGGTLTFSNGSINLNTANAGGGIYVDSDGVLYLKGTATLSKNHVPTNEKGGGIYLLGKVIIGDNSKAPSTILAQDNFAYTTSTPDTYTPTATTRNNIYLPSPTVNSDHKDVITVVKNGLTTSTRVGFSVPGNFVPVIFCDETSPYTYLKSFLTPVASGGMKETVFDDAERYHTVHFTFAPYDAQHIYLSSGTWVEQVTAQPSAEDGFSVDGNNVTISSEEGLAYLIRYINGISPVTQTHAGVNVTLTKDLDMGDYPWVPMASKAYSDTDTDVPFTGTFNGQGHTIANLDLQWLGAQTGTDLGLFGNVGTGGTVKNVSLKDASITTADMTSTDGAAALGSIAGRTSGGTVMNCTASATLTTTNTDAVLGGLVGQITSGTVHSSYALAELTGYQMGGLAGSNSDTLYNSFANPQFTYSGAANAYFVGGLVAVNTGQVENCYVRLSRTPQGLTGAKFGMLAGSNSGTNTIVQCYGPDGAADQFDHSYTYLYNNYVTGLSNCDLYKKVDAPYLYDRPNDNLVGSTGKTLTEKLNNWIPNNSDYAPWRRTTAGGYSGSTHSGNINDDYPIHKMKGLTCVGSTDGIFMEYKYSLNEMIRKYNGYAEDFDNVALWLYAAPLTAMTASGGTPSYESVSQQNYDFVKLYIDEDATLLQANGNVLKAFTSQTLGDYTSGRGERWHYCSSSLQQSTIGFNYGTTAQVPFSWAENPCDVTFSGNNDNALFPSDMPHINKVDLYCFYEPEYHWLNLKRNTASHWHMNATTLPIVYTGNGTGGDGNETSLVPGKGYLMSIDKNQLLQNWGTLNNGEVTLHDVTKTDFNAWAGLLGYNLLGNPYQSYLDIEKFMAENNTALWGGSKDEASVHTYAVYDPETDCYLQYKRGVSRGARATTGLLNPHQGFLIRKTTTDSGTNTQVKFTNAMRSNDGTPSFREPQPAYPLVNVILTDSQGRNDLVVLELGRDADEGVEKLRVGECSGRIGLALGSESYAILFRDETAEQQALRFEAEEEGEFTLRWETANAEFESLTLVDNIEGSTTDMLSRDSYSFEGNPDQYASRFRIVIGEYKGIDEPEVPEPVEGPTCSFAYQTGDQLVVEGEGTLEVVDMLGHVVMTERLSDGQSRVRVPQTAGVYLLRLTGKNGTRTQKIVTK